MNWVEVFCETSIEGLEIVSGLLYASGITGLMIQDERDFQEFLEDRIFAALLGQHFPKHGRIAVCRK